MNSSTDLQIGHLGMPVGRFTEVELARRVAAKDA
jgi:hypothetical protein